MKRVPTNTTQLAKDCPELMFAEAIGVGVNSAIERQEAQGQSELVNSDVLPIQGLRSDPAFAAMGIVIGEMVPNDRLFVNVTLPAGWAKKATDHSMWSDLLDEKGRKRASIFYKAAFYDRDAFIRTATRFWATSDVKHEEPKTITGQVMDSGTVIWSTETIPYVDYSSYETINKQTSDWLNEHYPDWKNAAAYWD